MVESAAVSATIAAPWNFCQRATRSRHILQARPALRRMNLQIRMGMRRFTRLTNAHSKKIKNHVHPLALHFMYYNFARIHQTLRVTPAMQAGVADHVWSVEEITALLD